MQESPWKHDDDDTDRRTEPTRTERGDSAGSNEMEVNHYEVIGSKVACIWLSDIFLVRDDPARNYSTFNEA